jgi:hypothetical protein
MGVGMSVDPFQNIVLLRHNESGMIFQRLPHSIPYTIQQSHLLGKPHV